jgi:PIN domain nuclease of toxin-antitoxin system
VILVDAPLFALWLSGDEQVGAERSAMLHNAGEFAITGMAMVEIAEKVRAGGIRLELPLQMWLELAISSSHCVVLPISAAIAARAARLDVPDLHDRILLATAMEHDLEVATLQPSLHDQPGVRYLF